MFHFFFRTFTYFYNFKKLFYIPYVEEKSSYYTETALRSPGEKKQLVWFKYRN